MTAFRRNTRSRVLRTSALTANAERSAERVQSSTVSGSDACRTISNAQGKLADFINEISVCEIGIGDGPRKAVSGIRHLSNTEAVQHSIRFELQLKASGFIWGHDSSKPYRRGQKGYSEDSSYSLASPIQYPNTGGEFWARFINCIIPAAASSPPVHGAFAPNAH